MKTIRIRMRVCMAGQIPGDQNFSAQPGDVIDVEAGLAAKWVRSGHAAAAPDAQLTDRDISLADLTAEEALLRGCTHCPRPARYLLRNLPFCARHFRAELES